jgi:ATP-dependent HslUV protease subunit HslV
MAGDGQITVGETVVKHTATKIRRLYEGRVLVGFAGSAADALTLLDRFEEKLHDFQGNVQRASIELAKQWRTDKMLRPLQAMLLAADSSMTLLVAGTGEVIQPDDGILGIGSGGAYATSAARALARHTALSAREIALEAMKIAGEICVYTNTNVTVEEL